MVIMMNGEFATVTVQGIGGGGIGKEKEILPKNATEGKLETGACRAC